MRGLTKGRGGTPTIDEWSRIRRMIRFKEPPIDIEKPALKGRVRVFQNPKTVTVRTGGSDVKNLRL